MQIKDIDSFRALSVWIALYDYPVYSDKHIR